MRDNVGREWVSVSVAYKLLISYQIPGRDPHNFQVIPRPNQVIK